MFHWYWAGAGDTMITLHTVDLTPQFIRLLGYFKFIYFLFFIRKFRTQKDFQYHSEPYKTPPADRRLRDLLESSESTWRGYELFEYHLLFLIRWNAIWNSEKLNIKKNVDITFLPAALLELKHREWWWLVEDDINLQDLIKLVWNSNNLTEHFK